MSPKGRVGPVEHGQMNRERIARLTRIYHTPKYAGEASGIPPSSLARAAKRFGLKFRSED